MSFRRETPRTSDDNLYQAVTNSFWDVGNYKRTVKRIDDGARLCDDFMKLIAERAEIEAKYANKLKVWAKKWDELIQSGPEYGTAEAAMRGTITEAESRSQIHLECRDRLMASVHDRVKKWKGETYHKTLFQWKETKEAEEGFTRAQKPWAKRRAKVEKSKKAYHAASKTAEQTAKLESDANSNSEITAEKFKKIQDAAEKAKREMEKCRGKYQDRLDDITSYNSTYESDMISEFNKCQDFEEKRLVFFRDTLLEYHNCLDISESHELKGLFVNMLMTFQKADSQHDLDWWSHNHGIAMAQNWPVFEELGDEPAFTPTFSSAVQNSAYAQQGAQPTMPPVHEETINVNHNPLVSNPFEGQGQATSDGWDESSPPPAPSTVGVPVRALYDYIAVEEDELTFYEGDILTKLTDEDEQGWCQGRLHGKEGLFPANYVEPL